MPSKSKKVYCFCGGEGNGNMVACNNDPACQILWYHFDCVGLKEAPEGDWICPSCSEGTTNDSELDTHHQSETNGAEADSSATDDDDCHQFRETAAKYDVVGVNNEGDEYYVSPDYPGTGIGWDDDQRLSDLFYAHVEFDGNTFVTRDPQFARKYVSNVVLFRCYCFDGNCRTCVMRKKTRFAEDQAATAKLLLIQAKEKLHAQKLEIQQLRNQLAVAARASAKRGRNDSDVDSDSDGLSNDNPKLKRRRQQA